MKLLSLLCLLFCASLASCSRAHPTPGPIALTSDGQMQAFLSDNSFERVGESADYWTFDADGSFEARVGGESLRGSWTADRHDLHLRDLTSGDREPGAAALPDRTSSLGWLDGKLNIEIDGVQYRSSRGFLGR